MRNKIQELLAKAGMTQMELCEKVRNLSRGEIKLAPNQVSLYASDKVKPTTDTAILIAKALNRKVEDVFQVNEKVSA